MGVPVVPVELVVGLDTFQPVSEPDPLDHRMHSERYRVPGGDVGRLPLGPAGRGRSARRACGRWRAPRRAGAWTGARSCSSTAACRSGVVDVLLTNFHLPRTTLLMMIDAFVGPRWRTLYATALAEGYRFLSFGDAMLLDRHAR